MIHSHSPPAGQRNAVENSGALWICMFLALATVAAYWPVVHADFINYDDPDYVSNNTRVLNGLSWKNLGWAFTTRHASNWHPVTWLSHMVDVELFGKGPRGPHVVNLLLHAANACLLLLLLRQMTGALWRSAIVAGLFALHPLHVESVAWVSERKDVLSTMFWMLTLIAYAQYVAQSKAFSLKSVALYTLTLVLFALGLMTKPMLVTLPCVMLLLDYWPLRRVGLSPIRAQLPVLFRLALEKAPFLLLSGVTCVLTTWAQKNALAPLVAFPLPDRLANVAISYSRYLGKMFWPVHLGIPYLHPGPWPDGQVIPAAMLAAGLCLGAFMAGRKYPFLFTGWFWYLGTLIPVIGLVQVGVQTLADRYTYVPLVGVFVILVWGVSEVCVRWRVPKSAVAGMAVLVIVGLSGLTRKQAGYWHDTESLFIHSAESTQNNFIALSNVGGSLFERGKLDEALGYYYRAYAINTNYPEAMNSIGAALAAKGSDEAVDWFLKALALNPDYPDPLFNLGNAMAEKGNAKEAVKYFREHLRLRPENFEAQNNLGVELFKLGQIDDALDSFGRALEINPNGAAIHKNLGEALAAKGRLDEAVHHYRMALMQTNDAGMHYSLGLTLAVQSKWKEAIEHYQATLRLSPTNADAQYNLGYAFKVQGKLDQAAEHLKAALRLKPEFPLAHYNLACVLADRGQRGEAISHLLEAVRLKPDYAEATQKLRVLEKNAE